MSDWFSGRRRAGSLMPDLGTLQTEVNRVFADLGLSPIGQGAGMNAGMGAGLTTAPRLDVVTTESGGYEIHVDLPGLEEKDIDLAVDGDLLTLRGERRQEQENRRNYRVRERAFGSFSRTIALPFEARPDQIDAEFKNGVLTIRVERPREPERSGSKVNIRSGTSGASASSTVIEGQAFSGGTGGESAGGGGMMGEGGGGADARPGGMMGEGG